MIIKLNFEVTVEIDYEKALICHGENWIEAACESAREFGDDIKRFAEKHPFCLACKVSEHKSPNVRISNGEDKKQ